MRWSVFTISCFVLMVLDVALRATWSIGNAYPDLLLILAIYIGLSAPPWVVGWAYLIIGVLSEMLWPYVAGVYVMVGPITFGYVCGAYVIVQMRGLAFRDSPLTFGAMTLIAGLFIALVSLVVITIRKFLPYLALEPLLDFTAVGELWRRLQTLLYTAVVAMVLSPVLLRTDVLWNFEGIRPHRKRRTLG